MKRVAVFGNAGGGKSKVARELAAATGLPLVVVDMLQFRPGGEAVPHEEFLEEHARALAGEEWIIDGFGGVKAAWERFEVADTLIHVDLPLPVHFLGVTERFVKGLFANPPGWPEGSPIVRSTMSSYRVLWPCHSKLTPRYRSYLEQVAQRKRVIRLESRRQSREFLDTVRSENLRSHASS